ncbi:MAG: hypothetical protein IT427_19485 [Pirellulales bacterium]|nr:hypothetical protein [Pirellulales bacterium]
MASTQENLVEKIHPATRELLPDDPLEMHAFEVPGDPELMFRLLAEEYARIGMGAEAIMQLARNPFYQGLHGLWRLFGEEGMRNRLAAIVRRCGVIRTTTTEPAPPPETVQIRLPIAAKGTM